MERGVCEFGADATDVGRFWRCGSRRWTVTGGGASKPSEVEVAVAGFDRKFAMSAAEERGRTGGVGEPGVKVGGSESAAGDLLLGRATRELDRVGVPAVPDNAGSVASSSVLWGCGS